MHLRYLLSWAARLFSTAWPEASPDGNPEGGRTQKTLARLANVETGHSDSNLLCFFSVLMGESTRPNFKRIKGAKTSVEVLSQHFFSFLFFNNIPVF